MAIKIYILQLMRKHNPNLLAILVTVALIYPICSIQPTLLLPIQTTKGIYTEYSFSFIPQQTVPHSASINVIFPFEFDPRSLIAFSSCKFQRSTGTLTKVPCTISNRTFTLPVSTIALQQMTVVIGNILNPIDSDMSSLFTVQTLFQKVIIQQNIDFGKTPFTASPIDRGSTMIVNNYLNTLVEMGSSWVFNFTLSKSYPVNTTIRFIFPEGFSTLKIQCNITGISDAAQQTRVFPNGRVYDCLNIKSAIVTSLSVIVSGVINPNYAMTVSGIEAHILQPNSIVVLQKVQMNPAPAVTISQKAMNVSVTIPNLFRNNTLTYIFQINMDSDLSVGDYLQLRLTGNWTYFVNDSIFIEGVNSDATHTPVFQTSYNWPSSSDIFIKNFSSIYRSSQIAFYISLRTPLTANTYSLTLSAYRSNGGLVERYTQPIAINATTGYIQEMRLHPMIQAIKLPVGKTGPLEITLGLMNNLPKTNVLTYGKIVMQIIPNLPLPNVNTNGVPKCYFYGNIEAKNCTYNATNPSYTEVIAFTPVDFNFQSSQIPFMVTTEGYISPEYEGLTIDTLVKRYHFHIQFYTESRPQPIPTEVIFGDWVADSIPLTTFSCNTMIAATRQWDHLVCTFTTPAQDLCQPGYFHFFRIQFTGSSSWYGWQTNLGYNANHVYPDYPCVAYGTNLLANPYIKCDLVTWPSGTYASQLGRSYVNIYGFELLPGGSTITVQIPHIQRNAGSYSTQLQFSILQDTWGYQTDEIILYSQLISSTSTNYISSVYDAYTAETVSYTLSNSIINKITDITLNSYDLGTSGVTHIVFEVDQTLFQDIGRAHHIVCGIHTCSKFNKPLQYFIVYPSRALAQVQSFTFPSIVTPVYAGTFEFRIRVYKSNNYVKHAKFNIVINPQTMSAPTFTFSALETETVIYPNTDHYYTISFTTKNPLPASTSYIQITLNNYYTISSDYCVLTTTAPGSDTRGVQCQTWVGDTKIFIQKLGIVPASTVFTLSVQLRTTSSAGTIAPTVSIITYYSSTNKVDQVLSAVFSSPSSSLTNTNLQTLTNFNFADPQKVFRKPTQGYFGHLLLNFQPVVSNSRTIGYYLKLTFTNEFYPYGNTLNLPLSCKINSVRLPCTYTLLPFVVTISQITNLINIGSNNPINITTQYQDHNGIYYPASQGRYLIQAQINNNTNNATYENVQQYVDILPGPVSYFNVSYAHRDTGKENIFQLNFRTGAVVVPAYNDATTQGRILIGFPTKDDANNDVFSLNLGFSTGAGTIIPCWFGTGVGYISSISGTNLTCKLRDSPYTPKYVYVQVINFNQLPAYTNVKIVMAKIVNPASQKYDANFLLRINALTFSTKQQSGLYESYYNMFFNMLTPSVSSVNEVDSTTTMFQLGAKVGDYGKYINVLPYTAGSAFLTDDWYIIEMNSQFSLNGQTGGCLPIFYQYCIVFRQINWFAVKIGNTTLLPLQLYVLRLPLSISRVDTIYKAYNFKSTRYAEIVTYTITASYRWMELRGAISGFSFQVLGSQDKLNINQKNVDVMVSFTTSHIILKGGSIEIKFPTNSTTVPKIRPQCRSVVTLGSQLQGYPTGKPSTNVQGDIGCLIQNTYSWVITSFDELPAGSQISIVGSIDLPTVQTASLGMGFVVTYSDTHASNVFSNGRIIDYLSTNFPLQVNNKTWNLDSRPSMYKSEPLRVNHQGELKFKLNLASTLNNINSSPGYIEITVGRYSFLSVTTGGFQATSNLVCSIVAASTAERFGCKVVTVTAQTQYYYFKIQTIDSLSPGVDYQITLNTQNGAVASEGIVFPTTCGVYKIDINVKYSSSSTQIVSQPHFVEVYGPDFKVLNFYSTISTPNEFNMILIELIPPQAISQTAQQIVIQFPTVAVDGTNLFPVDLGMGYDDYDDLIFDMYQSSITSMTCKVYTGDNQNNQPAKIVCSSFSAALGTTTTIKMGFWVKNPQTSIGLAIPVQIYSFDPYRGRKNVWSIIQSAIKVIPTSVTPIADLGNFATSSTQRQTSGVNFDFTTRNTKIMTQNDLYILKFNFDLRMSQKQAGSFKYNSGFSSSGDVIFMQNCQTIILRVGTSSLNLISSGSTTKNSRIEAVFYNPPTQLTTSQAKITGYACYIASGQGGEVINHNDAFPALVPRQMSSPTFSMAAIHSNLNKGAQEDYLFTFVYSTSSSATDMALVKQISITFPPYSTYDFTFSGIQCIQHPSSVIEVDKCWIDTSTYTIWIVPYQKATYINSNNFMIETKGLSIINPINSGSINLNSFVVKFYTWTTTDIPVLYPSSDDYVFFKQDGTNIPSSTITYTGTYIAKHDFVKFMPEQYVNQFQPSSADSGTNRMKTPFEFVVKAMATFSTLSSNYHEVRLTYNSYYTYSSTVQNQDLFYYIPTCHLNGARLHYCVLSGGKIITRFQQGFSLGQEMAFRFSVLNQKNDQDDGFTLSSFSNPTITLPLQFYPYGGSNYYAEAQPFHSFQRASGVYPQLGIYSVTMSYGTQVLGKINYLEFALSFSRNDINGLVLEIPVVSPEGVIIYDNPTLLGLPSGSQYPCSVGIDVQVFCYYEAGSNTNYGRPIRIYITRFAIQSGNTLSLRMMFTNPDNVGVFPSFIFKAFGGSFSAPNHMGSQLMGRYKIIDPYKTYPELGYYSTAAYNHYPDRNLYNHQTNYDFYIPEAQNQNSYVMVQWILTDPTYGQIGQYVNVNSYINDYFVISYSINDRRVYLVKKLGSYYGGSGTDYHRFGYLRQTHFLRNGFSVYLLKVPSFTLVTSYADGTWITNYRMVNYYGTSYIQYYDIENKVAGSTSWHYVSVSLGSLYQSTTLFDSTSPQYSDMILAIKFYSGRPFNSFYSTTHCHIESGVSNYDKLNPVTCELDTTNQQFIIRNVGVITDEFVKIYYYANTISSDQGGTAVQARLYANSQSYSVSGGWALYISSSAGYNIVDMYYIYNGNYDSGSGPSYSGTTSRLYGSSWADQSGYAQILSVSSNSITVRLYRGAAWDPWYTPYLVFRFYVERLSFSGCNDVSFTSNRYSSNYYGENSCGASNKHFWVTYDIRTANNDHWLYWYAGDFYDFTFAFNSVTGDRINPSQLFVSCTVVWIQQYYYNNNQGKCGCSSCCYGSCYYWGCCNPASCWWYFNYGTFLLTGGAAQAYTPYNQLADWHAVDLISRQRTVETEIYFQVQNMRSSVGPSYNSFLLFRTCESPSHTNNNPFPQTRASQIGSYIDCFCVVAASISITASTTYQTPTCVRYIMSGYQPSIAIYVDVPQGQSVACYLPGYLTSTSSTYNRIYIDVYKYSSNFFTRYFPWHYWTHTANFAATQTYNTNGYAGGSLSVSQSFWTSASISATNSYDINITSPYYIGNPIVYMSMSAPKPTSNFCNSGFYFCRVYTSFKNRRFYLVAQRAASVYTVRFTQSSAQFPPSQDSNSFYFNLLINYCEPSTYRYYHTYSTTRSDLLSPTAAAINEAPMIYGNNLAGYTSGFLVYTTFSGKTLYGYQTSQGEYQGSFVQLVLSGFSSILGCGVTLSNRIMQPLNNPMFCQVKSSNELQIHTRKDIYISSGNLIITLVTTTVPTSVSYTLTLFDKYVSGSDYGRLISSSGSFARSASGFTVVQPTSIVWRRQVYKQYQASAAPIRFIFNNGYQYVYDYVTPSNSDTIEVYFPGGILSSVNYVCFIKEYSVNSRHLYREYEANCAYYTTDTIKITSIPSRILSPDYYYEFAIYINSNGASMSLALSASNTFLAKISSVDSTGGSTVINRDFVLINKYQSTLPIALNSIYTLTMEASATNSLYIDFTVNTAGVAYQYMEFEFDNLGLSSFQIANGDQLSCYLHTSFATISGKNIQPRCRGYTNGLTSDSPLIIRVQKFASFGSGTNFYLAFDQFSNPAVQTLYMYPINVRITFFDRTNKKTYTSYFPSVYASDSINRGVPTVVSGSLSRSTSNRGSSTYHYISTSWPYSSNYNDISQKMLMKINGGVTACAAFSSFTLSDNNTGSYTLLWTNKISNISVYRTPSQSVGVATNIKFNNIVNPYPIQKQNYEQIKKLQVDFYSGYQNVYIKQLDQFAYSTYTSVVQFSVSTNFLAPIFIPLSGYFHTKQPMTYDISYSTTINSFSGRSLDYTILQFTAGVLSIQKAYIRYSVSPYIVNSVLDIKIFKDASNYWCLKIPGMDNNAYNSIYTWIIRMRFFPNGNNLDYISTTYAKNGQVQFSNSDSESLSTDNYSTLPVAPTTFELFEKSYVYQYYLLQRKWLYATTGLTSKKIQFRFTTPYTISSVENFNIVLPVLTALIPQNSPNSLTCVIQQTYSTSTILGAGLDAPCTYSVGVYTVNVPVGGLTINKQYTISIMEFNQTTSTFTLPASPARYEVSFIYNSQLALKFGDTYVLNYAGYMTSYSVNHLILKIGTSNFIGFTFTPQFALPAASLTVPITQSVLEIEFENKYFADCLGIDTLYSNDGMTFQSGAYFTHYSSPSAINANTRLLCGQYSSSYTTTKLRVTDYDQFLAGSSYYFRFPMISNPGTVNTPFIYKVRLLSYANSNYYPTTVGYFEYNGLESTVTGNTYQTQQVRTSLTNAVVQTTLTLSIYYVSYSPPNGAQIAYKLKNSNLDALTSLTSLTSLTGANYAYQYYPNINLCMFKRNTGTTTTSFSLGTFTTAQSVSTFSTSFVYAYHDTSTIYYGDFTPNTYKQDSITYVTSWTSSSFVKVSGLSNTNSMGIYTITFSSSALSFPQGSYMVMTIDTQLVMFDEFCYQIGGFVPGTTITTSNLICRKNSAQDVYIAGYNTIAAGTSLSVTLYLQVASVSTGTYNPRARIIVYDSNAAKIIDAYTNTYTLTVGVYGSSTLGILNYMEQPLKKVTAQQFRFSFTLASNTLVNGYYVQVNFGNWTIDAATTQGKVIWKYQVGSNIYWVPAAVTQVSANKYRIFVNQNYSMTAGQLITVWVYQQLSDAYNGIYFPNIQWNYLAIKAYNTGGTVLEHQYARYWIEPYHHTSLQVTPILKYVGATTLYEFAFTPNVSAAVGDVISVQFLTNDGYQTSLFSQTLGKTMVTNDSYQMSCQQSNYIGVITSVSVPISCELYKGSATASPPIPTVIQIPIKKAVAANTQIKFNILNILNPSVPNYPIAITVKLQQICESTDQNNLCTYYKSIKYLYFATSASVPGLNSPYGSLSFNPNRVSATNTQHTFTGSYTVNSGDYVRIIYYPQIPIPTICSLLSGGICYSYPLQNTIVIVASSTQTGSYSFTLTGMTNLYQSKGNNLPTIQIWDASGGVIRGQHQPDYWVNHITTDPVSSNQLGITFTPTLTPNYQLKYSFNNIARIQMSYLLQNEYIKMIYLTAPAGITIETTYCNATMESTTSEAAPYPYRFQCLSVSSNAVQLILQDNFPTWTSAFINKKVVLYLKYQIANYVSGSCSNWDVATYTALTTDSRYRVSEGWGNFNIIDYQSPYIWSIDFPTMAFNKRTCRTSQQCMFYGYLLPSTPLAVIPLSYMTFTLPQQFGYSNLTTYTACKMKEKNDDPNTITCTANRTNSDVTVKFVPSSYNHNYKLINIDTSDQTKLFKAPAYPGTHYQMKVNLFTSTNVLVESMKVNLTTVYGDLLNYTYMSARIPKDANAVGLFQLKFKVGAADILPGYQNSANNRITSKIQFIFSKSFASDLGTGKNSGDQVACLAISGLTLLSTGKLTCKLFPSYSTITYPYIEVTGYDRVLAYTDVVIRIAGLKTLDAGLQDYIKMGVSLTYYDYGGVKGYVYEPTGIVVGNTTAASVPVSISPLTTTQSSSNFVGQLVNYTFSGTINSGFATVKTTDYFVVEFQSNVFEGVFEQNLKALCSMATNSKCLSFGLSKIIYFSPSASYSSSSLAFTLKNVINTAYSFEYVNITFQVSTLVDDKINAVGTSTITKFSKPSTNASAIVSKIDSLYGGDSGINYYFQFKLNSNLPKNGLVSIQFPSVYTSLFLLNSTCILSLDFPWGSYCEIVNSKLLVIRPNGNLLNPNFTYQFTVTNLTNPNMKLTNYSFTITTQFNDNVYSSLIISRNKFACPEISVLTVKTCTTFEVTLGARNAFFETVYDISLICPSYIKEASEMKVYLSWSPDPKSDTCSSASDSLYSQQCAVLNQYIGTTKLTYLSLYMKQISPQKLISLKAKVKNGMLGTYSLVANVSYKGFTYLSTTSNSFFINSDSVQNLTNNQMTLKNYPINRAQNAIYTIKMPKPIITSTTSYISDLTVELPSQISVASSNITCISLSQSFQEDYFKLILSQQLNTLSCSVSNNIITITNVTSVISALGNDDFLRIAIFRIKNSNISTTSQKYKFSFVDSSTGTGSVLSSGSVSFPLSISPPPGNLQINTIVTASNKLLVSNLYTFTLSTVTGEIISVNSLSQIGLVINFPKQYKLVWNRIETMPTIYLQFKNSGTVTATFATLSSGINGTLIGNFSVPTAFNFTQVTVSFIFVNPSTSINCSNTPLFNIVLHDFKKNSFIAETLNNNIQCPVFSDRLYQVNVSGNAYMEAGTVYQFVISIEKPSQLLSITPRVQTSAIYFDPSVITFSNFTETVKSFKAKISNGLTGTFLMSFTKVEGSQIFYNDIPSINLTVKAPSRNYSIKFTNVDTKSIGLPILLEASLETENSKQITLVYTHNCSSQYAFDPSSFKNIASGTKNFSISVTYSGSTIPTMCAIDFSISSVTTSNYQLSASRLYISCSKSIDRSSNVPAMRIQISPDYKQSRDVGVTILNKQTTSIKPVFYNLTQTTVGSNSAQFLSSVSESGIIYFAVMQIGTNRQKVKQSDIYAQSVDTGVSYGSARTNVQRTISTVQGNLTAKSLLSQTTYLLGAYVNSSVGISDIKFEVFTTKKSSNGASITLAYSNVETNADIINAVSKTLRIAPQRINILTVRQILTSQQSTYQHTVMNTRQYVYEIVVGPNTQDDSIKSIDQLNQFAKSADLIKKMKQFLPSFIYTYSMATRQIILAIPKFRPGTQIQVLSATHQSVKIRMNFWEQAYAYAVIVSAPTANLLSAQVVGGLDQNNTQLATQHAKSLLTDSAGTIEFQFTLLESDKSYKIFASGQSVVPYQPRQRVPDSEVQSMSVKTAQNLNLKGSEDKIIAKIKEINPEMAGAVEQHIKDINNKKKTSPNSQSGYTNTKWWQVQGKKRVIKKINSN